MHEPTLRHPATDGRAPHDDVSYESMSERIDSLFQELEEMAAPDVQERVEELVARVTALYGAGLTRLLHYLEERRGLDEALADHVKDDRLLSSLLVVHGLHPDPAEERVHRALDSVRPALARHGGDVELVEVTGSEVTLRLLGSCRGCGSSRSTLDRLVRSAILEAAPEMRTVEVLETTSAEAPPPPSSPLVHIGRRVASSSFAAETSHTEMASHDRRAGEGQRCELCAAALAPTHRHVVDKTARTLCCACPACSLLFQDPAAGQRYRTVPERVVVDPAFAPDLTGWTRLGLPVSLAFVFVHGEGGRPFAVYPSPAGPTEAELSDEGWLGLGEATGLAALLEPDVEAVLLRRHRDGRFDCLLAPIDVCYDLVGTVRRTWRGFEGGAEAREAIDEFFQDLLGRGRPLAMAKPPPRGALTTGGDS